MFLSAFSDVSCNISSGVPKLTKVSDNESKNGKIFRPWDAARKELREDHDQSQDHDQDATISTTSEAEEIIVDGGKGFKTPVKAGPATNYEFYPAYPDYSSLVQSLGLPGNDPVFLESLGQGYALEEYARVLSQEHQAKLLSSRKQRPKKYKCPHCDVGFSNNGQLKGHIRIHTGERPFKCDEKNCGKTFTRNEELTRHKRIHSGLRPFPCPQCGKRFGRKDHLKKHSRTHMQPRGLYAVPVMLPFDTWTAATANYPYIPMFGY